MEDPAGKKPKPFYFTLFEWPVIILDAISHQNTFSSENCWPAVSEGLHRSKLEKGGQHANFILLSLFKLQAKNANSARFPWEKAPHSLSVPGSGQMWHLGLQWQFATLSVWVNGLSRMAMTAKNIYV